MSSKVFLGLCQLFKCERIFKTFRISMDLGHSLCVKIEVVRLESVIDDRFENTKMCC